jgi:hypothetical protein
MAKHAFLSASGAPAWMRCEAKPWREKGLPDETSEYAEEGIKAHELLEVSIKNNQPPYMFNGYPAEMQYEVQKVLDTLASFEAEELYSEQRLDISFITTEKGAEGTADVVIAKGDKLIVVDLKYGFKKVEAEENEQLLMYGAAALEKYDVLGEIKTVEMIISQPRLNNVSTWVLPASELRERLKPFRKQAIRILSAKGGDKNLHAIPGDKQCEHCKIKATCPENRGFLLATVTDDFVDLDKEDQFLSKVENATERLPTSDDKHLATCWTALDMIENWCKAVRAEVDKRALSGNFTDDRVKVVQGKRGNRKWRKEDLTARIFKDAAYEKNIKTPATLEKEFKGDTHKLGLIKRLTTQTEGKPTVVLATDKREALELKPDFEIITDDVEFTEALVGLTKES